MPDQNLPSEYPEDKIDRLIAIAAELRAMFNKRTGFVFGVLVASVAIAGSNLIQTSQLESVARVNRSNGDLLVNCTTPGTNPTPKSASDTGNACWDRLHATAGTNDAIATIVDDIYCDHRRAQAKLPPVPDPRVLCRNQTPAEVLNGAR